MSEEKVTLDLIGARLLALTTAIGDLQQRVGVLESRFTTMEVRIGGVEHLPPVAICDRRRRKNGQYASARRPLRSVIDPITDRRVKI